MWEFTKGLIAGLIIGGILYCFAPDDKCDSAQNQAEYNQCMAEGAQK